MVALHSPVSLLLAALAFVLFIGTSAEPKVRSPRRRSPTPSYPYKQTNRDGVVIRAQRPASVVAAAKRQVSPPVYPVSTCPGYTSTGTVPWAVYTGVDIAGGPDSTLLYGVPTREACYVRCEQSPGCIATPYSDALQRCWLVNTLVAYRPPTQYTVTRRGVDCASNAVNIPANYATDYGATCCTEYRSS